MFRIPVDRVRVQELAQRVVQVPRFQATAVEDVVRTDVDLEGVPC